MPVNNKPHFGDCECCSQVNVKITLRHGNMWMCDDCYAKEEKVVSVIAQSRTIDSQITMRQEIMVAATVPAIELRGAIYADESITQADKALRFTEECFTRFQHFQKVVFDKRQELTEAENAMRAWQVQVQTSAGELRKEQREKYKNLDISYTPQSPKSVKPAKEPTTASAKQADIHAACIKAGIVEMEPTVTMLLKMRKGMSIQDAIQSVAKTTKS